MKLRNVVKLSWCRGHRALRKKIQFVLPVQDLCLSEVLVFVVIKLFIMSVVFRKPFGYVQNKKSCECE